MKLYHSPASPYARKVRTLIAEKDLTRLIEDVPTDPYANSAKFLSVNPLGKIPALVTDDGLALFDSPVICAYLDAHSEGKGEALLPASGRDRWLVMRGEALGDGLMDLGLYLITEKRKPDGEKSPTLTARRRDQVEQTLDALFSFVNELPPAFNLAHISIACALGYFDFRHAEIDWRNGRGELAAWYSDMSNRSSLAATAPI
ncbi:MAG: glutathione S-transferase N-terminal domain-containing protein [Hyphomicrobiales bacterium]|nr:glutathione S-transferase N-terminal domain-containing protein [Hyphomicrobiales bacterium]